MAEVPTPGFTRTMTGSPLSSGKDGGIEPPVFLTEEVVAGRFRIVGPLGAGGMGQVFEAEDLELGTPVALKVIRPRVTHHGDAEELFRREVQLARQVTHPNVCRIFDLVVHHPGADGTAWGEAGRPILALTMELLEGETLAARIARQGPLPWPEALELLGQLAAALDAAHGAGIYHCDLKAANVVLTPARAVVTDFGLARSAWTGEARPEASPRGTPGYLAPEVLAGGQPTAAADRYALGVVAYQILTGCLPTVDGPSCPELPSAVGAVLSRAQHPDPAKRFPDAAAMVVALRAVLGVAVPPRQRRWRAAAVALPVLGILSLGAAAYWQAQPGADQLPAEAHLEAARQALRVVDYSRGRAAAARAVLAARTAGEPSLEAEAHLLLAGALEAIGEVARADEAMSAARRILEQTEDRCGLARASLVLRDTWDGERSPLPLEALPPILEQCADPSHLAIALARLGKKRSQVSVVEAEGMLDRALTLARQAADPRALAQVWNNRGSLEYRREDLQASEAAFARAVAEARRAEDPYLVAGMLTNQSWILGWLGRHDEEEAALGEAGALTRRIGNRYLLARILQAEAGHHERRGDLDEAAASLEEAHRLSLELGDATLIGMSLARLASLHERRQDWTEAIAAWRQAAALRRSSGQVEHADRDLLRLARLLLKVERTDEAETLVAEVEDRYQPRGDADSTLLYSRMQRLQIHLHRGEIEAAAALFQRILPQVVSKEEVGLRRDAARLAVELDRRLGEERLLTTWRQMASVEAIAAGAPGERVDQALQLRLDLGRLVWFQGEEDEARQRFREVAQQARALDRTVLVQQAGEEDEALRQWTDFWTWQH